MSKRVLLFLLPVFLFCSCNKPKETVQESVAVSESEPSVVDEVVLEEEPVTYFMTHKELDDYMYSETKAYCVENHVFSAEDTLFVTGPSRDDSFRDDEGRSYNETFFYINSPNEFKPVKCSVSFSVNDGKAVIESMGFYTLDRAVEEALEAESEEELWPVSDFWLDFYSTCFDELLSFQEEENAEILRAFMKEKRISGDVTPIGYMFGRNLIGYTDPITAVKTMIPTLKDYSIEQVMTAEQHYTVYVTVDKGPKLAIRVRTLGKNGKGQDLYGLEWGGGSYPGLEEDLERLYNVTLEDLEEARAYTYEKFRRGEVPVDFWYKGSFEGSDAELYAATSLQGYVVKAGQELYPVNLFVSDWEETFRIAGDFDEDGATEYGFTMCNGRGTGFYTEALVIVDPNEEKTVSIYGIDDVQLYNNNLFSTVQFSINRYDNTITLWRNDGYKKLDENTIKLGETQTDDYECTDLEFGWLYYIEYYNGQWYFDAKGQTYWSIGGPPHDEEYIDLFGKLKYNDGAISLSEVSLSCLGPEVYKARLKHVRSEDYDPEKDNPDYSKLSEDFRRRLLVVPKRSEVRPEIGKVIYDDRSFTVLDHEEDGFHGKKFKMKDYDFDWSALEPDSNLTNGDYIPQDIYWKGYTTLDLDGDGAEELVYFVEGDALEGYYLIFTVIHGEVYSYIITFRDMGTLKTDGTMKSTQGASWGEVYVIDSFQKDGYKKKILAYLCDEDNETAYYVGNEKVSWEEFDRFLKEDRSPIGVWWTTTKKDDDWMNYYAR